MRFDSLLVPVSESEPCGPDLDEIGDDDYLNYMLGSDNRIPERYLDAETGAPFDRSKIELAAEVRTIAGFLERTRDLRLLALEARFQALAGQIIGFCECVKAISQVCSAFWDTVHPQGSDGDFTLRQNITGVLDDRKTVVLPLQYAPLVWDQRAGAISLRDFLLATGAATPIENERKLDINQINQIIRSEGNRAATDAMHAALSDCKTDLKTLRTVFDEKTSYEYSPGFDLLFGVLDQLTKFLESAREDLRPSSAAGTEPVETGAPESVGAEGAAPASPSAPTGSVKTQAAAGAAILAAELYFGQNEPSSPALILVHQASLLVGKPLVVAIETLMADNAAYASMTLDASVGFGFGMAKMREITDDYTSTAQPPFGEVEAVAEFSAETRGQAVALLNAAAGYFRTAEPSSPIPMLLGQAERFASLSFQTIMSELMPKKE